MNEHVYFQYGGKMYAVNSAGQLFEARLDNQGLQAKFWKKVRAIIKPVAKAVSWVIPPLGAAVAVGYAVADAQAAKKAEKAQVAAAQQEEAAANKIIADANAKVAQWSAQTPAITNLTDTQKAAVAYNAATVSGAVLSADPANPSDLSRIAVDKKTMYLLAAGGGILLLTLLARR